MTRRRKKLPVANDLAARVERAFTKHVLGDAEIKRFVYENWLATPLTDDGKTPADLIAEGRGQELLDAIERPPDE